MNRKVVIVSAIQTSMVESGSPSICSSLLSLIEIKIEYFKQYLTEPEQNHEMINDTNLCQVLSLENKFLSICFFGSNSIWFVGYIFFLSKFLCRIHFRCPCKDKY